MAKCSESYAQKGAYAFKPSTPLQRIGGLSAPSKMPCHCWSIPAEHCITGSKLRLVPHSTCSKCYALKGMYVMPNVRKAMDTRFDILTQALADGDVHRFGTAGFVSAFSEVLNAKLATTLKRIERGHTVARDGRYFRWFDSGDLQSVQHLQLICNVALNTPDVKHWLPTREKGFVKAFLKAGGTFPSNLNVRLSLPMIDQGPSELLVEWADSVDGLTLSGVHKHADVGVPCVAPEQMGHCADCRACWNREVPIISYHQH